MHIRGTSWFPNLEALIFFSEEVLPHLRTSRFDESVRWVGGASTNQQQGCRQCFGVELTGYVDDVRPPMPDALCHIVPPLAGGGTRLKIVNSWAIGKRVMNTSIGCEGLDAKDSETVPPTG